MIISHKHKFIFLHCRKTAGSSIKTYLNRYLGPNDLQLGSWPESIQNGGRYNRRFFKDFLSCRGIEIVLKDCAKSLLYQRTIRLGDMYKSLYAPITADRPSEVAHPLAIEVKRFAPEEWETYFKFCFVRNPYDQTVSAYKFSGAASMGIPFLEFLKRLEDSHCQDPEGVVPRPKTNWPIYTINDKPIIDFIGRFEQLEPHFETVCERIGVPLNPECFPHMKASHKKKESYRDWYGSREKMLVDDIYAKELELFDYEF